MENLTAQDIMQRHVICIPQEMSVKTAFQVLQEKKITGAPVIDREEEMVGVISISDIAEFKQDKNDGADEKHQFYFYADMWGKPLNNKNFEGLELSVHENKTVEDIMTPVVIHITEDTSIHELADTMINAHVHRLVVTKNNKVVGIVTATDMLKVIRDNSKK